MQGCGSEVRDGEEGTCQALQVAVLDVPGLLCRGPQNLATASVHLRGLHWVTGAGSHEDPRLTPDACLGPPRKTRSLVPASLPAVPQGGLAGFGTWVDCLCFSGPHSVQS